MSKWIFLAVFLAPIMPPGGPAVAADFMNFQASDGTPVPYMLRLPKSYRQGRPTPFVLALPGGRQGRRMVDRVVRKYWGPAAEPMGFAIVSPAAPKGKLFYKDGDVLIPQLLRHIQKTHLVSGGKFHLAGSSNGGVSAFHLARLYPDLFSSLTVLAGFPEKPEDFAGLDRLAGMRVSLFVGDGDLYWKEGMIKTRARLARLGVRVRLEILPRNGHFFPDLSYEKARRIFDHLKNRE